MLNQKIKRKRKEHGFSQNYVADKLDVTPSAYGKIERGETRIDVDRLKQIAEALETDVLDFFEDDAIIVTHNADHATGNNAIAVHPSYNTDTEAQRQLVQHLEEEVALLRKEKDQLFKLIEKLSS